MTSPMFSARDRRRFSSRSRGALGLRLGSRQTTARRALATVAPGRLIRVTMMTRPPIRISKYILCDIVRVRGTGGVHWKDRDRGKGYAPSQLGGGDDIIKIMLISYDQ